MATELPKPKNDHQASNKAQQAQQRIPDFIVEILDKQKLTSSETPRASIIMAASYVDDLLTRLLKKVLIKPPDADDRLFDSSAPLYNFGAKIVLAYRLGLISEDFAWVLHRIRKLRDECAHSHDSKDYSKGDIKDLIDVTYAKTDAQEDQNRPPAEKIEAVFTGIYIQLWMKINSAKELSKLPPEFK